MDTDVAGRVVIVTGGNRGVGRIIARRFLEEGAKVVTCSRGEYDVPPAAEGLDAGLAANALHVPCDVRDYDAIGRVVDATVEAHGRLDVLVNNAGGSPVAQTEAASPRFHAAIIAINLTGPLWFSQRVHPVMAAQDGGGSIVNISSMASVGAAAGLTTYGAAKAGLNSLTRSLAVEWGPKVRVNCIAPGTIETEALDEVVFGNDPDVRRRFERGNPLERIGRPEEVADLCIFLSSGRSAYVNGSTIWIDGGGARRVV